MSGKQQQQQQQQQQKQNDSARALHFRYISLPSLQDYRSVYLLQFVGLSICQFVFVKKTFFGGHKTRPYFNF